MKLSNLNKSEEVAKPKPPVLDINDVKKRGGAARELGNLNNNETPKPIQQPEKTGGIPGESPDPVTNQPATKATPSNLEDQDIVIKQGIKAPLLNSLDKKLHAVYMALPDDLQFAGSLKIPLDRREAMNESARILRITAQELNVILIDQFLKRYEDDLEKIRIAKKKGMV